MHPVPRGGGDIGSGSETLARSAFLLRLQKKEPASVELLLLHQDYGVGFGKLGKMEEEEGE